MKAVRTDLITLSSDEMKTIAGGLRAEWMDVTSPETDPEADLKALWMDGE
jgi:hypothetical protein